MCHICVCFILFPESLSKSSSRVQGYTEAICIHIQKCTVGELCLHQYIHIHCAKGGCVMHERLTWSLAWVRSSISCSLARKCSAFMSSQRLCHSSSTWTSICSKASSLLKPALSCCLYLTTHTDIV